METMTVKEVLQITVNLLGNISVPRKLNEQIGVPIDHCIGNLRECMRAMDAAEAQKAAEEPEEKTGANSDE